MIAGCFSMLIKNAEKGLLRAKVVLVTLHSAIGNEGSSRMHGSWE